MSECPHCGRPYGFGDPSQIPTVGENIKPARPDLYPSHRVDVSGMCSKEDIYGSSSPQGNDGLIERLRRRRGILGALEGDLDMMEEAADALAHLSAGGWREEAKLLLLRASHNLKPGSLRNEIDRFLSPTPSGEEQKEDSFAKAREHFQELLDDQTFVAPQPEQEGECNHYFAQDGICIYCHAPLAASGGGFPKLDSAGLRGAKQVAREQLGIEPDAPLAASGGGEEPINLAGDEFDTLAGNLLADMEVESHLPGHVAANAQDTLAKVLRCLISKRHAIGLLRAKQPSPAPATDGLIERLKREGMLKTFKCAELCIEAADALAAQQREIDERGLDFLYMVRQNQKRLDKLQTALAAAEKQNAELRESLETLLRYSWPDNGGPADLAIKDARSLLQIHDYARFEKAKP